MPNWTDDEGHSHFNVSSCKRCLKYFETGGEIPVHDCLGGLYDSVSHDGVWLCPRKLVVHCKKQPFDVYVGRPSSWGNPFSDKPKSIAEIKVDSREEAIACYEEWLKQNPTLLEKAKRELKGKVLGCWCSPKACHADILVRIANDLI